MENSSEVIMVESKDSPVIVRFTQRIKGSVRLGKEVKISPKANACLNEKGYKIEYFTETVSVCIGIGKDYTAELIMTEDAWRALKKGEKINITTTKQFKELYG
jgi:hypothetical protein